MPTGTRKDEDYRYFGAKSERRNFASFRYFAAKSNIRNFA